MNFLMRTTSHVAAEPVSAPAVSKISTLEGLSSEDPFPESPVGQERDGVGEEDSSFEDSTNKNDRLIMDDYLDVSEEEGCITIPHGDLPEEWNDAPDIHSLHSLDRSFVFPGEQIHILACLSASKQDTEIITPFKVAAVMSKNGRGHSAENENEVGKAKSEGQDTEQNENNEPSQKFDQQYDISASESILRMEDHKRRTETSLQRFKNSHFFVRISESGQQLWSKRISLDSEVLEMNKRKVYSMSHLIALIDRGSFDAKLSGGAARDGVSCFSLRNGDIVVLLQVNVGVSFLKDPVIEIIQFEKYQETNPLSKDYVHGHPNYDPCGDLLKWLLPLDNTIPPASSLTSPHPSSNASATQKSSSSSTQIFSHFRSYSMSSLPQNSPAPPHPVKAQSSKPSFDIEDFNTYSSQKLWRSQKTVGDDLLSFRGVPLERERFSVRCGLQGMYVPGRRWRRKLEIVQPVEIHSFASGCNTDDLLCVQIKNVSPVHAPDVVIYVDTLTIILEEPSGGGPLSILPTTCIEAGSDHCLPNLALRRGEEHSFFLKPTSFKWKDLKGRIERQTSSLSSGSPSSSLEGINSDSSNDRYAILVSCRCNYTESSLFFKQPTSWRPRVSREFLISVASDMSRQSCEPYEGVSKLPIQVLTLQASNLTSEDLTLTVRAPASFTAPPSIGSLTSSPTTPLSPFLDSPESRGGVNVGRDREGVQSLKSPSQASEDQNQKQNGDAGARSISEAIPNSGLGCTHLWLQSIVPLGRVPAHSTATIKLELLPLTDGIVTLDTLQIDVKEKGITYVPEQTLRINATSSISTGIL